MPPSSHPGPTAANPAADVLGPYGAFRNNSGLMTLVIVVLIIEMTVMLFSGGFLNLLLMRQYETQGFILSEKTTSLDNIVSITENIHVAINLVLVVLFAIWINRTCKNAWMLDAPHMTITPGWSVGYYFIPILNLWKPYMAMKQIRRASYGNDRSLGKILALWWTCWIVTAVLGMIAGYLYASTETPDDAIMVCKVIFISTFGNILLSCLAIALVYNLTRTQKQRVAQW